MPVCDDGQFFSVSQDKLTFFSLQAHKKYLKCIAFTSLVLAAKINEEDEVRSLKTNEKYKNIYNK